MYGGVWHPEPQVRLIHCGSRVPHTPIFNGYHSIPSAGIVSFGRLIHSSNIPWLFSSNHAGESHMKYTEEINTES